MKNASNGRVWTFKDRARAQKFLDSYHLFQDDFELYLVTKDTEYNVERRKDG